MVNKNSPSLDDVTRPKMSRQIAKSVLKPLIDYIDSRENAFKQELRITHEMIDWQLNELRSLNHDREARWGERQRVAEQHARNVSIADDIIQERLVELGREMADLRSFGPRLDALTQWIAGIFEQQKIVNQRLDELQSWVSELDAAFRQSTPSQQSSQIASLSARLERIANKVGGDQKDGLALAHRLAGLEKLLRTANRRPAAPTPKAQGKP